MAIKRKIPAISEAPTVQFDFYKIWGLKIWGSNMRESCKEEQNCKMNTLGPTIERDLPEQICFGQDLFCDFQSV